jgi:hypothetical protein
MSLPTNNEGEKMPRILALFVFGLSGISSAYAQRLGADDSSLSIFQYVPIPIILLFGGMMVALIRYLRRPSRSPGPWNGYDPRFDKPWDLGKTQVRPNHTGWSQSGPVMVKHPSNGYMEEISSPGLWTLLFGGLYFAYKGVWSHAVLGLMLAIFTCGISWLVYPFFARDIVVRSYLRRGWQLMGVADLSNKSLI